MKGFLGALWNSRTFTKWKCETVLRQGNRFVSLVVTEKHTHTHVNLVTRIVLPNYKELDSHDCPSLTVRHGTARCIPSLGQEYRVPCTVHPWPVSHVPYYPMSYLYAVSQISGRHGFRLTAPESRQRQQQSTKRRAQKINNLSLWWVRWLENLNQKRNRSRN